MYDNILDPEKNVLIPGIESHINILIQLGALNYIRRRIFRDLKFPFLSWTAMKIAEI
jgi:hypothetical protein